MILLIINLKFRLWIQMNFYPNPSGLTATYMCMDCEGFSVESRRSYVAEIFLASRYIKD
jgi:hypothetical protein